MRILQKLKFFAKLTVINIFILPIITLLVSNATYKLTTPAYAKFVLDPLVHKKTIQYKLNYKPANRIFITFKIFETDKSMSMLNFNVKSNITDDNLHVSLRYKSKFYLALDSLFMFLFIKLHLYDQVQVIRREIRNVKNIHKIEFTIPKLDVYEFTIEDVEDCNKLQIFMYNHEVLYFLCLYFFYLTIFVLSTFYIMSIKYRKFDTVSVPEVREFVDEEISHNEENY